MIITRCARTHNETWNRLLEAIERRELKVFAEIDHSAAAQDVGLELPGESVVVFGSPRAGTPLMQSDRRIGIELPLRILVWEDADGTQLGYDDPCGLVTRYDVSEHADSLEKMSALLAALAADAAG